MIKSATIYRLPAPWAITAAELIGHLTPQAFTPCTSLDFQTLGWIPPRENGLLVHSANRQFLLRLLSEKKILPANVINQVTKARAEEALKLLLKAIPKFPLEALRTVRSPLAAMTDWLASDEAPEGFTIDQDTELRATGEGKATVRFTRHTLELDDTRRHIEGGKQCTRLAMTWRDKISFILTANMTIKRIVPLDVLKEDSDVTSSNADERFDGDAMLMTGELAQMFDDLTSALGGRLVADESGAA